MGGYEKLLLTCEEYSKNVGKLQAAMDYFEKGALSLKTTVSEVNAAAQSVDLAMEENAKGVSEVSETMTNIAENVVELEEQATKNEAVAEELNTEVHKFKLE